MNNKSYLITGGSRGIGRATALALAKRGANVAISYEKDEKSAQTLRKEINDFGGICLIFRADVGNSGEAFRLVDLVETAFDGLDGLVCCAGIGHTGLIGDTSISQWEQVISVNLSGTFYLIQGVLPRMIRDKKGSIVTVSSVWGQSGASCEVAYSAAKAGVIGLTKGVAKEVGPCGIRVNCVAPGVIETDMISQLSQEEKAVLAEETPLSRLGTREEVAQSILFLLSEKASFITGQVLAPNGGFYT